MESENYVERKKEEDRTKEKDNQNEQPEDIDTKKNEI
jgi:hypothetical protein